MRINFLISSLSGGGAEKVLTTLAEQFANVGNEVSILSLEKRPQFYSVAPNVRLVKQSNKKKSKLAQFFEDIKNTFTFLKERQADISISFLSRCNLLCLLCQPLLKNKIIVCDRNNPLMEHSRMVFRISCQLYRLAAAIVVQTNTIKSFYPQYLQKKIHVIENPVDMKMLERQIAGQQVYPAKTVVSMGRLEAQKDFETLIEAFAHVAGAHTDWQLKIYGIGNRRESLQSLIDKFGMNSRIYLCGRTEKPFYVLKSARIFVLSSHYEGFPNVLCEGMYAGLPCISSDCVSGPSELIKEGENGYLFPIGNVEILAEKLEVLIQDEQLCETIGNAARATIVQRLSVDMIFSVWQSLVKSLV